MHPVGWAESPRPTTTAQRSPISSPPWWASGTRPTLRGPKHSRGVARDSVRGRGVVQRRRARPISHRHLAPDSRSRHWRKAGARRVGLAGAEVEGRELHEGVGVGLVEREQFFEGVGGSRPTDLGGRLTARRNRASMASRWRSGWRRQSHQRVYPQAASQVRAASEAKKRGHAGGERLGPEEPGHDRQVQRRRRTRRRGSGPGPPGPSRSGPGPARRSAGRSAGGEAWDGSR